MIEELKVVDKNFTNENNDTLLHTAYANGQKEIIKYLENEIKCEKNILNKNGLIASQLFNQNKNYSSDSSDLSLHSGDFDDQDDDLDYFVSGDESDEKKEETTQKNSSSNVFSKKIDLPSKLEFKSTILFGNNLIFVLFFIIYNLLIIFYFLF